LSGMATAAVQAFILAFQILGISYLPYALEQMLVMALWKGLSGFAHRYGVQRTP
jgi:hypothetical protein